MRIEELPYNECFWIALATATKKRGWKIEHEADTYGVIRINKERVATFSCRADEDPIIRVKVKTSFDDIVDMVKEVESIMTSMNISHFKTDVVIKKDWGADEILKEVLSK